jgi:hypothetical protein
MRLRVRCLAWLCLTLMLWTVMAEATHNHANQTESASCTLCVAAHSSAPAPTCHQCAPVFATVDLLSEEEVLAKTQLGFSKLGIRGPPAL